MQAQNNITIDWGRDAVEWGWALEMGSRAESIGSEQLKAVKKYTSPLKESLFKEKNQRSLTRKKNKRFDTVQKTKP